MTTLIPFRLRSSLARKGDTDPFQLFRNEMDQLMDNFLSSNFAAPVAMEGLRVPINVSETDKELRVRAELPGIDEKDVEVTLHGDLLTIKGEKKAESEEGDQNYHVAESSYGAFSRTIQLPYAVDEEQIKARFNRGVLDITLPKPREAQKTARKIEIQKN